MVRLVIIILFILVATIPSASSLDIIRLRVSDLDNNTYNAQNELRMHTPFTFMIHSNKSLHNYRLYCYNKHFPYETYVNGIRLVKDDDVDVFTLEKSIEPKLSMDAFWTCLLKSNSSEIKLNFLVDVHPSRSYPGWPQYQTGNAYYNIPTSFEQETGKRYGYGYTNNNGGIAIVAKDNKAEQYAPVVPVHTDTVFGKEENVKTIQAQQPANQVKQDTSTLSTNTLIFIIAGIALLQSFIIIAFVVRKKNCCRKRSVEEPRSEVARAPESEYQELNYPKVSDIVNRPPLPLPPQKRENIYHYNSAYDHRIIPPPPRQKPF